ncbi:MAG: tripartite tricarboxylate transporter substrate binding protein [Burkholderiales bacterium]|nr:tripartite tricarboxylate transporter substrate binding protein [Burkholderiales bacterium]
MARTRTRGTPRFAAACLAAWLGVLAQPATAQDYPTRPITVVVPFPAGAAVDNLVRPLTGELARLLGQPVVVDNKGGAQGVIGTQFAARAKPDGYTLLAGSSTTLAANVGLFKSLPYDPLKDFVPIAGLGYTSMMFLVRADSPAKDLKGLVALLRSQPSPMAAGFGSSSGQVALAILSRAAGVSVLPISYKGTPQVVTDLLGGSLPMAAIDVGSGVPHIGPGGRLTALAITGSARSVSAPNVPTLSETYPGSDLITWIGIVAPAGTPAAVVTRLHAAIFSALATPEVRQSYASLSTEVEPVPPDQLGRRMQRDQARWVELIRAIGIQPQ